MSHKNSNWFTYKDIFWLVHEYVQTINENNVLLPKTVYTFTVYVTL